MRGCNLICNICSEQTTLVFNAKVLGKYDVKYYHCTVCDFLQTEKPYWLEEAYDESINISDTGIMKRNYSFSKIATVIIFFFFDRTKKFLDFAGGYGIFTRLMRDIGYDYYWYDKYSGNLVARGYEYNDKSDKIELLTSFEAFEHFENPIAEIEKMLKISKNILFSTNLTSNDILSPEKWWYYGLEHGQHISFYNKKTFEYIAKKFNLNFYTNNSDTHLLTAKKINKFLFKNIFKMNKIGLSYFTKRMMKSLTLNDMNDMINRISKK